MRDSKIKMINYKYFIILATVLASQNAYSAGQDNFFLNVKISKKTAQILAQKHQSIWAHIIYKTSANSKMHGVAGPDGYIKFAEEVKRISPNKEQQIFIKQAWQNHEIFIEPIIFSSKDNLPAKPANLLICPAKTYRIAQKRIVVKCFL